MINVVCDFTFALRHERQSFRSSARRNGSKTIMSKQNVLSAIFWGPTSLSFSFKTSSSCYVNKIIVSIGSGTRTLVLKPIIIRLIIIIIPTLYRCWRIISRFFTPTLRQSVMEDDVAINDRAFLHSLTCLIIVEHFSEDQYAVEHKINMLKLCQIKSNKNLSMILFATH